MKRGFNKSNIRRLFACFGSLIIVLASLPILPAQATVDPNESRLNLLAEADESNAGFTLLSQIDTELDGGVTAASIIEPLTAEELQLIQKEIDTDNNLNNLEATNSINDTNNETVSDESDQRSENSALESDQTVTETEESDQTNWASETEANEIELIDTDEDSELAALFAASIIEGVPIVTNYEDLALALADESETILIANSFALTGPLDIQYNVTFYTSLEEFSEESITELETYSSPSLLLTEMTNDIVLTSAPGQRHFILNGQLTLDFGGLVLDGGGNGGGLEIKGHTDSHSELYGNNLTIQNCIQTGGQNGGAIIAEYAHINLDNVSLTNNQAANGGAIYSYNSRVHLDQQVHLSGNRAPENGGAIYIATDGDNDSGVFLQGSIDQLTSITNNTAGQNGGGIYFDNYSGDMNRELSLTNAQLSNNSASTGDGGGVYFGLGSLTLTITSDNADNPSDISNNRAAGSGGAFYLEGRKANLDDELQIQVYNITVYNTTQFIGNHALSGSGGVMFVNNSGGSLYFYSDTNTILFQDNTAVLAGGAIYIADGKATSDGMHPYFTLNINHSDFINNRAVNSTGGAIHLPANIYHLSLFGTNFTNNQSGGNGGAIYIGENLQSSISIAGSAGSEQTVFQSNQAAGNGGAIYYEGYQLPLDSSLNGGEYGHIMFDGQVLFHNNSAVLNGGAIYHGLAPASVYYGSSEIYFDHNVAGQSGGAIYQSHGELPLEHAAEYTFVIESGITFTNNKALNGNGGAIAFESIRNGIMMSDISAKALKFTGNEAPRGIGGAIYVPECYYVISNNGNPSQPEYWNYSPLIGNVQFSNNKSAGTAFISTDDRTLTEYNLFNNSYSQYDGITHALNNHDISYQPLYLLTFDSNGGVFADNELTYEAGFFFEGAALTSELNIPVRNGYEFANHWYLDEDCTQLFDLVSETMPNRNLTLYADWKPIAHSLTYILNGGTVNQENPSTYTIETPQFTLNNPAPREGYTFLGWLLDGRDDAPALEITIPIGSIGDRTYIAVWEPVETNEAEESDDQTNGETGDQSTDESDNETSTENDDQTIKESDDESDTENDDQTTNESDDETTTSSETDLSTEDTDRINDTDNPSGNSNHQTSANKTSSTYVNKTKPNTIITTGDYAPIILFVILAIISLCIIIFSFLKKRNK